jgi:hypothetical protein
MDLNKEIWEAISATPRFPEKSKQALHVRIMRLIEESRKPTGKKLGATIMTQEASMSGQDGAPPATPKNV